MKDKIKQPAKKQETKLLFEKLCLSQDFRNLKKGYKIEFNFPITLLVGENGSGKSTVLDLIRSYYGLKAKSYYKSDLGRKISVSDSKLKKEKICYYDFHSDDMKYSGYFGEDMISQINAMRSSSGEGALAQFMSTEIIKKQNSLVLLDEIGRGGSPRTQYLYSRLLLKSALEDRNQIIASTHSIPILELSFLPICKLYSMEDQRYVDFEEFMKSQRDITKSTFLHREKSSAK